MRSSAEVWLHFQEAGQSDSGKTTVYRCNYCDKSYSRNSSRMLLHLRTCTQIPTNIQTGIFTEEELRDPSAVISSAGGPLSDDPDRKRRRYNRTPRGKEGDGMGHYGSLTEPRISGTTAEIDRMISQAVFMSRVPFAMLENPFWTDVIGKLRPGYRPPNSTRLKTLLLESEYSRAKEEIHRLVMNCKTICITTQGWAADNSGAAAARDPTGVSLTNGAMAPTTGEDTAAPNMIDFALTIPQPLYYLSMADKGTLTVVGSSPSKEAGENAAAEGAVVDEDIMATTHQPGRSYPPHKIAREIKRVIETVGPRKVTSVVTDNPPDMRETWQILSESYPNIKFYGSSTHGLRSLMVGLMDLEWTRVLLDKVSSLVRYFTASSVNTNMLRHAQMEKLGKIYVLNMPNPKHWATSVYALFAVYSSRDAIEALAGIDSDMEDTSAAASLPPSVIDDPKVEDLIRDRDGFWVQTFELYEFIHPFAHVLSACERSHSTLSTVYHDLLNLRELLAATKVPIKEDAHKLFEEAFNFIYHPVMLVAYELDPKYHMDKREEAPLTEAQENMTTGVISEVVADLSAVDMAMAELANFRSHQGVFEDPKIWESAERVDSVSWWHAVQANAPYLASVALQVLLMPASCVTIEHVDAANMSSQAAELDADRCHMLDYIRYNLRVLRELHMLKPEDIVNVFEAAESVPFNLP